MLATYYFAYNIILHIMQLKEQNKLVNSVLDTNSVPFASLGFKTISCTLVKKVFFSPTSFLPL